MDDQKTNLRRPSLRTLFSSDELSFQDNEFNTSCASRSNSNASTSKENRKIRNDYSSPPVMMSPWNQQSPYVKSPWILQEAGDETGEEETLNFHGYGLIANLFREEGHVYSLAVSGDLLYTGSESKNVRVWKGLRDFSGFKSSSGLVKAIAINGDRVFTGHQDGKIRIWRLMKKKKDLHYYKRVGNFPTTRDFLRKSVYPRNYVQVRRHVKVPWIKHYDAVSCMSIDEDRDFLYSGSWDKTVKVWRISDSKCMESIPAHDDAVNSVVVAFDGVVFTCSADGTVKSWRRELLGKCTKHVLVETLLNQNQALTSLAFSRSTQALYAGSSNGLVRFWDREKHFMSYAGVLRGHKQAVLCLAVGGSLIVSGSADQTICVWRREFDGEHVFMTVLRGHNGPVKCLAMQREETIHVDEDEHWIIHSGSLDKSVKFWRVAEHIHR